MATWQNGKLKDIFEAASALICADLWAGNREVKYNRELTPLEKWAMRWLAINLPRLGLRVNRMYDGSSLEISLTWRRFGFRPRNYHREYPKISGWHFTVQDAGVSDYDRGVSDGA